MVDENEKQCDNKNIGSFKVGVLLEQDLTIPAYQRPYSWDEEQVIALIDDLIEAYEKKKKNYLIGNMIFHDQNIVDGQQRTITLSLIIYSLIEKDNLEIELDYYPKILYKKITILSSKAINKNLKIIQGKLKNYANTENFKKYIEDNVLCTYIKTKDLDEAFMLFDSQNTRGKALRRKDLLKVHHIRHIDVNDISKQEISAKTWESISKKNHPDDELDDLDKLFIYLALIRKSIRGELAGKYLEYLDVYKEFISEDDSGYALNNYNQPPLFKNYTFDTKTQKINFITKPLELNSSYSINNGLRFLPFEIIQSIEGGEKFFWFSLKYKDIYNEISNLSAFTILDSLDGKGNYYLRKVYKSLLLFFVDKFGFRELDEFSMRISILLFYYRYKMYQVRKEGVVNFKWDNEHSLDIFKLIFLKYSTRVLFREIDKYVEYKLYDSDDETGSDESLSQLSDSKYNFWTTIRDNNEKDLYEYLEERGRNWKKIAKKK